MENYDHLSLNISSKSETDHTYVYIYIHIIYIYIYIYIYISKYETTIEQLEASRFGKGMPMMQLAPPPWLGSEDERSMLGTKCDVKL